MYRPVIAKQQLSRPVTVTATVQTRKFQTATVQTGNCHPATVQTSNCQPATVQTNNCQPAIVQTSNCQPATVQISQQLSRSATVKTSNCQTATVQTSNCQTASGSANVLQLSYFCAIFPPPRPHPAFQCVALVVDSKWVAAAFFVTDTTRFTTNEVRRRKIVCTRQLSMPVLGVPVSVLLITCSLF